MDSDVIAGQKRPGRWKHVPLAILVGKTIEAVGTTAIDGTDGKEPCTVLYFTDKTCHGFVHPADGGSA